MFSILRTMEYLLHLNNIQAIRNLEVVEMDAHEVRRFYSAENAFNGT